MGRAAPEIRYILGMTTQKHAPSPEAVVSYLSLHAIHRKLKEAIIKSKALKTNCSEELALMSRVTDAIRAFDRRYDFVSYFRARRSPQWALAKHLATDDQAE